MCVEISGRSRAEAEMAAAEVKEKIAKSVREFVVPDAAAKLLFSRSPGMAQVARDTAAAMYGVTVALARGGAQNTLRLTGDPGKIDRFVSEVRAKWCCEKKVTIPKRIQRQWKKDRAEVRSQIEQECLVHISLIDESTGEVEIVGRGDSVDAACVRVATWISAQEDGRRAAAAAHPQGEQLDGARRAEGGRPWRRRAAGREAWRQPRQAARPPAAGAGARGPQWHCRPCRGKANDASRSRCRACGAARPGGGGAEGTPPPPPPPPPPPGR
ncbi:unnamed protein product [Prorocentrum cordatum]|uniref:RanBP2-type domain-containing protein n=1 Tax=Prorocentrum cordatum TaxID=2364126 RepID=A0ABN9YDY9_9DINO|nr:unnamed protein product [Polarella glacialis]